MYISLATNTYFSTSSLENHEIEQSLSKTAGGVVSDTVLT